MRFVSFYFQKIPLDETEHVVAHSVMSFFFPQDKKLLHVVTNNCVTATNKGYPVMEHCDDIPEQLWEIKLNDLSKLTTKRPP